MLHRGLRLTSCWLWMAVAAAAADRVTAFPGAEGAGRFAAGGRGGDVYHVTSLDDDGPGSLRQGLETAAGARTIVFDVAGTIALRKTLKFRGAKLTLAGQTAPGDGVTIRDFPFVLDGASDVVIRYLRFRLGDERKPSDTYDTLAINDCRDVILDHVSAGWSVDGILDTRGTANLTLQWCLFSEALHESIHPEGAHAMCASIRDLAGPATIHHNLFATSRDRHPTLGTTKPGRPLPPIDFRNNGIYNWSGTVNLGDCPVAVRGNYWRPGPETKLDRLPLAVKGALPDAARGYLSGNVFEGSGDWTRDNSAALDFERWREKRESYAYQGNLAQWRLDAPPPFDDAPEVTIEPAEAALERVLADVGASRIRDAVDTRVLRDVRERTGRLINTPRDVGGWPELHTAAAPADADRDGLPDAWERAQGLDPNDPADSQREHDGRTRLEQYLTELARQSAL